MLTSQPTGRKMNDIVIIGIDVDLNGHARDIILDITEGCYYTML